MSFWTLANTLDVPSASISDKSISLDNESEPVVSSSSYRARLLLKNQILFYF